MFSDLFPFAHFYGRQKQNYNLPFVLLYQKQTHTSVLKGTVSFIPYKFSSAEKTLSNSSSGKKQLIELSKMLESAAVVRLPEIKFNNLFWVCRL